MTGGTKMPKAKAAVISKTAGQKKGFIHNLKMDKWLYILMIPGLLHYIVFKYAPMWGLVIAFQDYNPFLGLFKSPWVGLKHFQMFFSNSMFSTLFKNTLWISFLNIIFSFPAPIILALMMNELRFQRYKRVVQTCVYIPHFLSWVIVASLTYTLFSPTGVVNRILESIGIERVQFLTSQDLFRPMIVGQTIWKGAGWGTIIYLAAIAGVDMQLYEAAIVDGAGRFRQLWHVTLPALRSTVVLMLILRLGDVLDTYVYTVGITQGSYSYSTAVGLFKSVIGIILIFGSSALAKRAGESGIF